MELVEKDIRPRGIMTRAAFENAIKVLMATGASTNLVIHLIAIARRAGLDLEPVDTPPPMRVAGPFRPSATAPRAPTA